MSALVPVIVIIGVTVLAAISVWAVTIIWVMCNARKEQKNDV